MSIFFSVNSFIHRVHFSKDLDTLKLIERQRIEQEEEERRAEEMRREVEELKLQEEQMKREKEAEERRKKEAEELAKRWFEMLFIIVKTRIDYLITFDFLIEKKNWPMPRPLCPHWPRKRIK